jgi:hypothetical protein
VSVTPTFSVKIASGDGVLARYGGSIVLAPADSPVLDSVLELARDADREHAAAPGRFLPRKVAGLVSQTDESPTLAIVSAVEDGLAVLLVGDVTLTLTDSTGTSTQSGRDATTWVDRIVRGPWTSLAIALDGAGSIDRRSDLQSGVVTAAGAELVPADAPTTAAAPMPTIEPEAVIAAPPEPEAVMSTPPEAAPVAAEAAPVFESFSLDEPVEAEPLPVTAPASDSRSTAQVAPVASDVAPIEAGVVMVQGIECSRQHFNDPTSIYCAVCGISMVHQTHNLVSGLRPPLGVLVLDDGGVFTLDGDYVIGREPDNAEEVTAGTATPLALEDPDVTMSRVHAKLLLVGWDVRLVDAGSANGTYYAPPGQTEWTRLPASESAVLKPGTKVSIGGRTLVFDSHHKL